MDTFAGIPEISVEALFKKIQDLDSVRLIDVRRPDEYDGELGHIEGAELVTLGPELSMLLEQGDRTEEIVFVCRSGARSGEATKESLRLGYKFTFNMQGGMLHWNDVRFPVIRK